MTQRFLIVLTFVNLALLLFLVVRARPAQAQSPTPVLRGRALEIVDDQGKVRASIQIQPQDKNVKMPNGKTYPETVILRLIDRNGQPSVKLATSEQEAGLALVGGDDVTYIVLKADLQSGSLKLTNKDGRQQFIQP
ncbi:MAG: hypothetical protein HY313_07590 [Acidobacteria bacterium]|nr:hypothetical protein [Acidobacteriota bacterium]